MAEVESYPESYIIKLWERSFMEDWKRYGADFESEDEKENKKNVDREEYNELLKLYK